MLVKIMQVTSIRGVHFQIGVKDFEEFKTKKQEIINSNEDFIDLIEQCTIKRNEILAIEYFEKEVDDNE